MNENFNRFVGMVVFIMLVVVIVRMVSPHRSVGNTLSYHAERIADDTKEAAHDIKRQAQQAVK